MDEQEMPKYKSHKEVWALKIKSIVRDGEGRETDGSAMMGMDSFLIWTNKH